MTENKLLLLKPTCDDRADANRLDGLFQDALAKTSFSRLPTDSRVPATGCFETITTAAELENLIREGGGQINKTADSTRRILFMAALGLYGINTEAWAMMAVIRRYPDCLSGCVGALIIDAQSEFYTKDLARLMAFTMNEAGCAFIGRPLVEATGSLKNFRIIAKNLGTDLTGAYRACLSDLLERLTGFAPPEIKSPKLLCIHASNRDTSNTLSLWNKVKDNLDPAIAIKEVALRNGEIRDCNACHFDMCMYYSRRSSCFFGGTIVEEVYPALSECDAVVMLCPNYNDALGANMTALINRLTALYRSSPFSDKYLYAIIVSGYSGGDIMAQQLIGSLNMNKAFILPPHFALMETANAPGSINEIPSIDQLAGDFASAISRRLTASTPDAV